MVESVQIDTGAPNRDGEEHIVRLQAPVYGYLDKKWTYEEYLEELKQPIEYPDPTDPEDPRYYRKYAYTVPPPEAYYLVPDNRDEVNVDKKSKKWRQVYYGWNNLNAFEKAQIVELQKAMKAKGIDEMPPGFEYRDWLKWI